jgi:hypothetical protein
MELKGDEWPPIDTIVKPDKMEDLEKSIKEIKLMIQQLRDENLTA